MPNLLSRFFDKVFGQSKEKAAAPKQEPVKEPQQDLDAGALLIKKAEQGDADAQYELYFYYTRGVDVARDEELALKCCHRAAEQGHGEAQVELGLHYDPDLWMRLLGGTLLPPIKVNLPLNLTLA